MVSNTPESAPVAVRVPRFVQNLNTLAGLHGLTARVYVDHYTDDAQKKPILFADWRGTESQLRSFPLVPSRWRLPVTTGQLTIGDVWWRHPVMRGHVTVNPTDLLYRLDFDEVPRSIAERDGVEVIEYADEIAYHGSREALIAAGIDCKRIPAGKRGARSGYNAGIPDFYTRRQPDGSYVYWLQTDAAYERKQREFEEYKQRYARTNETNDAVADAMIAAARMHHAQTELSASTCEKRDRHVGRFQRHVIWQSTNGVLFVDWARLRDERVLGR